MLQERRTKKYTYAECNDPKIFDEAMARYVELRDKPEPLTDQEKKELTNVYTVTFRHFFDPI